MIRRATVVLVHADGHLEFIDFDNPEITVESEVVYLPESLLDKALGVSARDRRAGYNHRITIEGEAK